MPKSDVHADITPPPIDHSANVLIISLHADPVQASGGGEGGGTHAYLRELLRALAFNRRHAAVVTRLASPHLPISQRLSDFTALYRIQLGLIATMDKRLLDSFHADTVDQIATIIRQLTWPVHILHGVYWNSSRAAMDLSRQLGIPFVQTVISNGRRRFEQGYRDDAAERIAIEIETYAAASAIFCISGEEREDLIRLYGIDAGKLHVVGRPVPLPFRQPAQEKDGTPRQIDLQHMHMVGSRDN